MLEPSHGALPPKLRMKLPALPGAAKPWPELSRSSVAHVSGRAHSVDSHVLDGRASDLSKADAEHLYPADKRLQGPPHSATAKRFGHKWYSSSSSRQHVDGSKTLYFDADNDQQVAARQPGTLDHAFSGGDLARGPQNSMRHGLQDTPRPVVKENRALARLLNEHEVRSREIEKIRAQLFQRKDIEMRQKRDYHLHAQRRHSDASLQLADEIRALESQIYQREMRVMQIERDIQHERSSRYGTPRSSHRPSVQSDETSASSRRAPIELEEATASSHLPSLGELSETIPAAFSDRTRVPFSARTKKASSSTSTVKAPLSARTAEATARVEKVFDPWTDQKAAAHAGRFVKSDGKTAPDLGFSDKASKVRSEASTAVSSRRSSIASAAPEDPADSDLHVKLEVAFC